VRRIFIALALCFCSLAMHGQKTRMGQDLPLARTGVNYPIKVHLSAIHYRTEYDGAGFGGIIYTDTVINGKKVELEGISGVSSRLYKLSLGDYQARLLKDPHNRFVDTPLFQIWEIVLPDRTVWRGTVTGILE
jgi:hypothetical protein